MDEKAKLLAMEVETRDERGIPLKSSYPDLAAPVWLIYVSFTLMGLAFGQLLAWPIYLYLSDSRVDEKLKFLGGQGLGWLYVSAFLLKMGAAALNTVAAQWRKESRVNIPDQHVYKVFTPAGSPPLPYVMFETEGDLGRFNRAQRAVQNYLEYVPALGLYVVLAGYVFPRPVCVCTALYIVCRILMAVQYAQSATGRQKGFMLSQLSASVIEGLLLICAGKALQIEFAAAAP